MTLNKLKEALTDYENILSDDEKRELRAMKKPDALAAIELTTRINANSQNNGRQGLSPSLAGGLAEFLQSVQNFSGVVDTFVSSNPGIAALVWGGVKFALLALSNATSYIEKLSNLFVTLQKDFPRLGEYEKLYQKSRGVQTALCNYYAMVIRLCHYSTRASRTSVYARLFVATIRPYESEFGKYEKQLKILSEEFVKEINLELHKRQGSSYQVQILIKHDQEEHGKLLISMKDEVSRHDQSLASWLVEARRRALEEGRSRILETFSSYQYQTQYNKILKDRVTSTSEWLCNTPAYRTWVSGSQKTLWCTGRLGSGKSFISAWVVAQLQAEFPQEVVSYFFCRYDDRETLKARTIVGSIAKQIAATLPADDFRNIYDDYRDPASIITFLKAKLSRERRFFIVLDGLDECTEVQIKELADLFHDLLDSPLQLYFYCSSRPVKLGWLAAKFQPQKPISLEDRENKVHLAQDISRFIKMTIQKRREGDLPQLEVGDQEMVFTILDRLEEGAEGMFFWTRLQIDILCEKKSDAEILLALRDLPRSLSQTYERILSQFVDPGDIELGKKIFCWAAIARRPLTLDELREAIAIQPLQKVLDTKRLKNNMAKALVCCGNLVLLDQESQTVHFTHSSVKDYLTSEDVHECIKHYHIDLKQADAEVGAICTTYLQFLSVPSQVTRTSDRYGHFAQIPASVIGNTSYARKAAKYVIGRESMQCTETGESLHRSVEATLHNIEARRKRRGLSQYSFQGYAEMFWLEHTKQRINPDSSPVLWEMWCDLIEGADRSNNLCGVPWTFEDWKEHSDNILTWIEDQDHASLVQLYLTSNVDIALGNLLRLFIFAASRNHSDLTQICLKLDKIAQDAKFEVLFSSFIKGNMDIVNLFIAAKFDVNARPALKEHAFYDETALQTAIQCGHSDIALRLLAAGADVNAEGSRMLNGRTALQIATERDDWIMIDCLLNYGADVNAAASYNNGRTALQAAAGAGHRLMVARLLREKADVNAAPGKIHGRTALQAAAQNGHLDIVERLLREKAEVNSAPCQAGGRTALQAAAEKGHIDMVQVLVDHGAKINAEVSIDDGRTALQAACESGHESLVDMLLEKGANVNAPPSEIRGRTALEAAAGRGFVHIVEKLLATGADIGGAAPIVGTTALQAAIEGGHLEIVEKLRTPRRGQLRRGEPYTKMKPRTQIQKELNPQFL